ncbi:hypothetical protein C9374_009003 [Naegleria lovaniensis]|uniref:Chromate transporter n=1 Tax=Naegleria lovaniensis TaxID=51637 RepID=A0AA88GKQ8_NAELO|nr:uncharacterized protein C9374_009003 [Naegleria lovaniensis]KAG2377918.1 hypothetical protein C9374_009003 [Naegleria lovaniensis]
MSFFPSSHNSSQQQPHHHSLQQQNGDGTDSELIITTSFNKEDENQQSLGQNFMSSSSPPSLLDSKEKTNDDDESHEIMLHDDDGYRGEEEESEGSQHGHARERISKWNMLKDVAWNMTIVGATSFRGGVANVMNRVCSKKTNWLSIEEFMEVYSMSHLVPGAKPSQIAMGVAIPKYGMIGGMLSYLFFSIPGFILCLAMGLFMYDYDSKTAPLWFVHAQKGLACSGIAFALQSVARFSSLLESPDKKKGKKNNDAKGESNELFPYIILTIVAIISMLYRRNWLLPVLLAIGSVLSIIYSEIKDRLSNRISHFALYEMLNVKEKQFNKLSWRNQLEFILLLSKTFIPKYSREMKQKRAELEDEHIEGVNSSITPQQDTSDDGKHPFKHFASYKVGISLVVLYFVMLAVFMTSSFIVESIPTGSTMSATTTSLVPPTVSHVLYQNGSSDATPTNQVRKINVWTEWIIMTSFFYRCGSLIYSGGVVNVVIIRDEMIEREWVTDEQFINGYSLTNAAPGPRFSLGFYFGAIIAGNFLNAAVGNNSTQIPSNNSTAVDSMILKQQQSLLSKNLDQKDTMSLTATTTTTTTEYSTFTRYFLPIFYGMLAGIAFHLPGFILLLGVVPLWGALRSKPIVQKAMVGINAVCVGYLINNIVILWISVVGTSVPLGAVSFLTFSLLNWLDCYPPIVVFIGAGAAAVLGVVIPL